MIHRGLLLVVLTLSIGLYGCTSAESGGAVDGAPDAAASVAEQDSAESVASPDENADTVPAPALAGTVYGDGVSLSESTQISAIFDDVDAYDGRRVRVEGLVTDVCEMRGCWLAIASDREFEDIRLKVQDGVIVFPMSARGQHVVAEGIVRKLVPGQAEGMHAGEHGEHQGEHEGSGQGSGQGAGSGSGEGMNADAAVQLEGLGAVILDRS